MAGGSTWLGGSGCLGERRGTVATQAQGHRLTGNGKPGIGRKWILRVCSSAHRGDRPGPARQEELIAVADLDPASWSSRPPPRPARPRSGEMGGKILGVDLIRGLPPLALIKGPSVHRDSGIPIYG